MGECRPIRILVVDDHPLAHSGMRLFLSSYPDLELVGEAMNGAEAVEACARLRPDVVLMDMMMPQLDGIEATRQIKKRFPQTRVIALTSYGEGDLVERVLRVGASGYLLKNVSSFDLAQAIRAAHAGRSTLAPEAAEALLNTMQSSDEQVAFTEREREVLRLLVRGLSNSEIAEQLCITRATVKFHVGGIFGKLGVATRAEAIAKAYEQRLVSLG
jgi:NarL family two-component system response regulator LiaR